MANWFGHDQPLEDLGRGAGPNFMQIKLGPPAGLGADPDVHKICIRTRGIRLVQRSNGLAVLHNYARKFGPAAFLHNQDAGKGGGHLQEALWDHQVTPG